MIVNININSPASMVSFPFIFNNGDNSLETVLGTDGDIYSIIGEGVAATLAGNSWLGNLANIGLTPNRGYWVRTTESKTLSLDVEYIDPNTTYQLHYAWNFISFPGHEPVHITEALQGYEEILNTVIASAEGSVYRMGGDVPTWVGSLEFFEPNKGYWINSNSQENISFNWNI